MKNLYSLFSLIIVLNYTSETFSQPDTLWTKTFGGTNIDVGQSVQQTTDSGYIISGYTRSYGTISGRNIWLIKTNSSGELLWQNTFGGNADEEAYSVVQTKDGGYVMTGYTKSFGAGLSDVILVKANSSGTELWKKTFGGSNDEEGYSVIQTDDGGFLIAGATSSFAYGGRDVWLVKTDSLGNEKWRKNHGGLSSDGARCVAQTSDGGFILTGWTMSYGSDVYGNALLFKTDSLGNEEWHSVFGGADADRGYCVRELIEGGYIITGYSASSGAGNDDLYLVKTDRSGNALWTKTFGGTGRDYGNSVEQTSDGGFIMAGYTLSFGAGGDDVYVVKTDSSGTEEWSGTYGGLYSDQAYLIKQTNDGSYIFTGHTLSYGAGVHDVWLVKLSAVVPVELSSFTGEVSGDKILLTWTTASEKNNLGFEIEKRISSGYWQKIGFVKGNGTTTEPKKYSFIDNIVCSGENYFRLKQIDLDGRYEYSPIVEVSVPLPEKFSVFQNYPNPFNPSTRIVYSIPRNSRVVIKLFDILGNEIKTLMDEERPAGTGEVTFNAENLPGGVYLYNFSAGSFSETMKMVLMK